MRRVAFVITSAFGFAVLSSAAMAQDDSGGRYLTDPAYLPLAGQIDGSTAFTMSEGRGNTSDAGGTLLSHFKDHSDRFNQFLEYGITDDLSVNFAMSYLPYDKTTHDNVGGGTTVRESQGFTDPSLGITWRALDQAAGPVNLDLFGNYSPNWTGSRIATSTSDGLEGRGGDAGDIGAAISHVTPLFTLYGSAAAELNGARSNFNPDSGTSVHRNSTTDWLLDVSGQVRLSDAISLNGGLGETIGRDTTHVFNGAGVEHLVTQGDSTELHLAANYAFIPNSFIGSLTYGHTFDGNSRAEFPADPANNTETHGHQEDIWGAKLTYAFN